MILEIQSLIWLTTPKGEGTAKFLIDRGPESDLYWVVFITETKEIWMFANYDVRLVTNISLGREKTEVKKIMKLSLTPREMVNLGGVEARMDSDLQQLGLKKGLKPPVGFQDHGLVEYQGHQYYMSTYLNPTPIAMGNEN